MNYTKENSSYVEIINKDTGEIEYHKLIKVKDFKPTMKGGYQMIYKKDRDEIIFDLSSKAKLNVLFTIENMFTKNRKTVVINQTKLAKKLKLSVRLINTVVSYLLKADYLKMIGDKEFMLNPYFLVPYRADGLLLQKEWAEMTKLSVDTIRKLPEKELLRYKIYLQSDGWKDRANECKKLAKYKCDICGSVKDLEAHHKTYDNLYMELQEDLQCLCNECHKNTHKENQ